MMFGERMRVARARSRKSLREVGSDCGVSAQAVKKYEDGKFMPSSAVMIALCRSLDVSAEWLLDAAPLDFHSTPDAPQGRHAKYWVKEALSELIENGEFAAILARGQEEGE